MFILNRKDQNVYVDVKVRGKPLVFIMHGLGGNSNQKHIQMFEKAFANHNFTTVLFDTTNSYGRSDGEYEDATVTNYYEDLEDVMAWAKENEWYTEPFWLIGHSLGGICTALFAERFPTKVAGLAPISTVVNWELSSKKEKYRDIDSWKEKGVLEFISSSGRKKRLKFTHAEDRMEYDLLPKASQLTMPSLLVVGTKDSSTPLEDHLVLFNVLPEPKELHKIRNAPHTFRDEVHVRKVQQILENWIKKTFNDSYSSHSYN